jgi:hypothetical protein
MRLVAVFAAIAGLGLVSGCAGNAGRGRTQAAVPKASPDKVADANDETTYVCEQVRPTGSHIPETQCRTVRQRSAERRAAQEAMVKPTPQRVEKPSN